jgi:hypothetical protein
MKDWEAVRMRIRTRRDSFFKTIKKKKEESWERRED